MCGRITQYRPAQDYAKLAGIERQVGEIIHRWNVAPTQPVAIINERRGRWLDFWTWGFVPHWAKDPTTMNHPINAKVETVGEKPMFRDAWRRGQRGLVPADGFYEWRMENGRKQPYFIRRRDGKPLLLAALWDHWQRPGAAALTTCVILVGEANELVAPLHDRMPVIISPSAVDRWLDRKTDPRALQDLLRPYPADALEAFPVSAKVNNAKNEGAELIEALPSSHVPS